MTLSELREACAKVARREMEAQQRNMGARDAAIRIEENIRAILLPVEPAPWVPEKYHLEKVDALQAQVDQLRRELERAESARKAAETNAALATLQTRTAPVDDEVRRRAAQERLRVANLSGDVGAVSVAASRLFAASEAVAPIDNEFAGLLSRTAEALRRVTAGAEVLGLSNGADLVFRARLAELEATLTKRLDEVTAERNEAALRVSELERERDEARSLRELRDEAIVALMAERDEARAEVARAWAEVQRLEDLDQQREAERDAALADAAKHRAKTEEARHLLSTLHVSVTDGHMHTALRAEHSCTMEALARLRAEADALRVRVAEIEAGAEKWLNQRDAAFEREEALRRELVAAREVLARVQWGSSGWCPACGHHGELGHTTDCPIGAELAKRGGA